MKCNTPRGGGGKKAAANDRVLQLIEEGLDFKTEPNKNAGQCFWKSVEKQKQKENTLSDLFDFARAKAIPESHVLSISPVYI